MSDLVKEKYFDLKSKKKTIEEEYQVVIKKDRAMTSSRNVAKIFNKRHDNMLRDISKLECSKKFSFLNFEESKYKDSRGKMQTEYLMTKDGFTFLVFGFTGKRAAEFKESYINEFNQMEKFIKERHSAEWQEYRKENKDYNKELTDVIKAFVDYAIESGSGSPDNYYKAYPRLVNKVLGIKDGKRDLADKKTLRNLGIIMEISQEVIKEGIENKVYYKDIYKNCSNKINEFIKYLPVRS